MGTAVAPAAAQEPPLRYEITPYFAYRVGGEFEPQQAEPKAAGGFELHEGNAEGLIFDIRTSEGNSQWELLYAHQETELDTQPSLVGGPTLDLDVSHFQFGGTYLWRVESPGIAPFLSMTAGLAAHAPPLAGADAETYCSWALGGGVNLRPDKRIGVRLEARAYSTIVDDSSALFCAFTGTVSSCAVFVEGDQLYQFEARVGLVARF